MGAAMSWIQKKVMGENEPEYDFPTTLDGFGYYFNKEGQMRHKETEEPFEFNVKEGNHHYNQKHYNAIGDIITEMVYRMMEKDHKLQRAYLPVNAEEGEPRTFVFISGDLYTNSDKLLMLVHGNGVVRAGQWARRLIINDCLDSGTMFPYIKWAQENGYSVIVTNPNLNTGEVPGSKKKEPVPIKGNSSPEEHAESVWREFVQRCPAKHVAIVAHSYGGVCTLNLVKNHLREFEERVFAIALTDSVHSLKHQPGEPEVVGYYKQHVVNWASAYDPLDAPLITTTDEVPTVSAGTDKHENTSYSSMHSIFKFIKEKYGEAINPSSRKHAREVTPADDAGQGQEEESKEQSANQNEEQSQMDQSGVDNKSYEPDTETKEADKPGKKEDSVAKTEDTVAKTEDTAVNVDEVKAEVKSEL